MWMTWADGCRGLYLALHQHGDVYKHVVELLDATFQTNDVFMSGFNLTKSLFWDARINYLQKRRSLILPHKLKYNTPSQNKYMCPCRSLTDIWTCPFKSVARDIFALAVKTSILHTLVNICNLFSALLFSSGQQICGWWHQSNQWHQSWYDILYTDFSHKQADSETVFGEILIHAQ